jgi:hypothetical protein
MAVMIAGVETGGAVCTPETGFPLLPFDSDDFVGLGAGMLAVVAMRQF